MVFAIVVLPMYLGIDQPSLGDSQALQTGKEKVEKWVPKTKEQEGTGRCQRAKQLAECQTKSTPGLSLPPQGAKTKNGPGFWNKSGKEASGLRSQKQRENQIQGLVTSKHQRRKDA